MSKELQEFYKAYFAWLLAGAPESRPFYRRYGLCRNIGYHERDPERVVYREMVQQFIDAGLDGEFPFGEDEYDMARVLRAQHINHDRIQWVRNQVAQLENQA